MLNKKKEKIMIAVENAVISLDIFNILRKKGYKPEISKIKLIDPALYNLIITDKAELLDKDFNTPVVYLDDKYSEELKFKNCVVLEKPFFTEELIKAVHKSLQNTCLCY